MAALGDAFVIAAKLLSGDTKNIPANSHFWRYRIFISNKIILFLFVPLHVFTDARNSFSFSLFLFLQ